MAGVPSISVPTPGNVSVEGTDSVAQRKLRRNLTWVGGFLISLSLPAAVLASVGPAIASIGTWATIALWGGSAVIGMTQNALYAEMATMFPEKPGIALYAHEAWKKYLQVIGPICSFGYWMGWSLTLAIFAGLLGSFVQAEWFPSQTWTVWDGAVHIGLAQVFGAVAIIGVWALNVFGVRPAVRTNLIVGVLLGIVYGVFVIGGPATGQFHPSLLTWKLGGRRQAWGGVELAMVWLYVMGWTAYATEICATFTPEYKNPKRDVKKALIFAGVVTLLAFTIIPMMTAGVVGERAVAANPYTYYLAVFARIVGPAGPFVTLVLVAAILIGMNSATADGSRALFGISRDGLTLKQFGMLNKHHIPGWAMTFDMVVNLVLLFFVSSPLGILFASNLGYYVCVVFAVIGFIMLRKDRPSWPRSVRLSKPWLGIAALLGLVDLALLIVGASNPGLAGYGGGTSVLLGLGLLAFSVVFWIIRVVVQDRGRLRLRDASAGSFGGDVPETGGAYEVATGER